MVKCIYTINTVWMHDMKHLGDNPKRDRLILHKCHIENGGRIQFFS